MKLFAITFTSFFLVQSTLACYNGYQYCYDNLSKSEQKEAVRKVKDWNMAKLNGDREIYDPRHYLYECYGVEWIRIVRHCDNRYCTRYLFGNDACESSKREMERMKEIEEFRKIFSVDHDPIE